MGSHDRIDEALQRARALLLDLEHARDANAAMLTEVKKLLAIFARRGYI